MKKRKSDVSDETVSTKLDPSHPNYDAILLKRRRQRFQAIDFRVRKRQVERAVSHIDDVVAAVGAEPRDEIVVHRDAAPPERSQQGRPVALDVGRQNTRRRAGRPLPRRARLEDLHYRAGLRQLVRDRATDYSCSDDDD